ncbi:hypothetical protein [Burkholderia cenocepacia]|jgi:hypothetical protein|uniref:Uncharacterized protein n=1 Tax=Dechloromonas agitata TaxID=73030 RepID=A0A930BUG7_9RHOO|nr:hypothetical protein [Burkholderia cenocepacia]MBF1166087.1 hypothetical protein [Dechloromonas agitata]MDI9690141.1 hypothetical protein [Burkholderia cenocepacia]
MMNFDDNKPYPDDVALLKLLGLPAWQAALHQETFVGEAFPYEPDEQPGEETSIQIYVTCCPAQFFRFVIERKSEDKGYAGMERVEVTTGSGTLSQYWPMALAIADHCLVVGEVVRFEA